MKTFVEKRDDLCDSFMKNRQHPMDRPDPIEGFYRGFDKCDELWCAEVKVLVEELYASAGCGYAIHEALQAFKERTGL